MIVRVVCQHFILKYGTVTTITPEERANWNFTKDELDKIILCSKLNLPGRFSLTTLLWCLKLTVLDFLRRIIRRMAWEKPIIWAFSITLAITYIAASVAVFIECRPFELWWQVDPDPGQCVQGNLWLITYEIGNMITDVMLIAVPFPLVFKAKIPLARRLQLCGLFSLGFFLVAICVPRLIQGTNHSRVQLSRTLWASIETLFASIVAMVPTIYVLYRRGDESSYYLSSTGPKSGLTGGTGGKSYIRSHVPPNSTIISTHCAREEDHELEDLERGDAQSDNTSIKGILVKTTIQTTGALELLVLDNLSGRMSLRPGILRIGRRNLPYSKSPFLRSNVRSYIVGNRVETVFKHPNPKRDSNAPPPRTDSVEDDWLLSTKRRVAKCLTYGTTPKEQEAAAQILKQLNTESLWRSYLDRFPSTDLAFGLRDSTQSNAWVDYMIERSVKVWLTNLKNHLWEDQTKASGSELNDQWLDRLDLVEKQSSYRIRPEPNDKFSILHRISSCYPYEMKVGSILISEKHRFTVAKSQHHYYWRDDLKAPSITNPYAQGSPGKFPEYVVSMLDKYYLHQHPYVQTPYGRLEIEEAVAVLEECYQRPEDLGSASKPATST
ncbi:hypothetical protein TWF970_010580 [Orbilia oligospora]|uniref:Rhodopsin domain-containing protein n=1 Tax=Orbilia oligospora TaxID=2813651 RepID=A0A7C8RJB6_ORBOL|nr:hypothetical protein TWF970_010580 [Orbilia oligospora]